MKVLVIAICLLLVFSLSFGVDYAKAYDYASNMVERISIAFNGVSDIVGIKFEAQTLPLKMGYFGTVVLDGNVTDVANIIKDNFIPYDITDENIKNLKCEINVDPFCYSFYLSKLPVLYNTGVIFGLEYLSLCVAEYAIHITIKFDSPIINSFYDYYVCWGSYTTGNGGFNDEKGVYYIQVLDDGDCIYSTSLNSFNNFILTKELLFNPVGFSGQTYKSNMFEKINTGKRISENIINLLR